LAQKVPGVQAIDEISVNGVVPKPASGVPPAGPPINLAAASPNELPQLEDGSADKTFAARLAGRDLGSEKSSVDAASGKNGLKSAPAVTSQIADRKSAATANAAGEELRLRQPTTLAETEAANKQAVVRNLSTPAPASSTAARPAQPVAPSAQASYAGKEHDHSISGTVVNQRFTQLVPVAKATTASRPSHANVVLTSFQLEQAGNQVRVIDRDGSTYAGFLRIADASLKSQNTVRKDAATNRERKTKTVAKVDVFKTEVKSELQAEHDYYFRVEGTNRSLNQRVVFSGHLLANTSDGDFSKTNISTTAAGQRQLPTQNQLAPLLLNARINGTAVIGESNAVEIQAVPVKP
jgi:hypothetical protein